MTTGLRIETTDHPGPERVAAVLRVVDAATEADGVRPLSEHVLLHLRYGGLAPARDLLGYAGEDLVAYAHLDLADPAEGAGAELVVHPAHRRRGYGRALVERLLAESPGGRLRLWAHGNHPGAAKLAGALGFRAVRELWRMRRSLDAPLPEVPVPAGVRIRAFVPGQDDAAWVALNARAFAGHPEQGRWTLEDLRTRMREPWFDPEGFFLAERESDGRLVGFHWTKIHDGDEPIGEIYVLGVDPEAQGGGLGKALALVGLRHLRSRGLGTAMLYVEATNAPAIRVYEAMGFAHWDTDVMFEREP